MPKAKAPTVPHNNAHRLLSVVEGDWSQYATHKTFQTFAGDESQTIDVVEYDWGLLRHDIHVLLHRSGIRPQDIVPMATA